MGKPFVSNEDESIALFDNKLLDKFTYIHPSTPVILYLPVIAFFMYRAVISPSLSGVGIAVLFVLGMLSWTLTEYLFHRYIFHYHTKSKFGHYIHFLMHGVHHDYPNDSRRLVMAPVVSIPLALFFFGFFWLTVGPTWLLAIYPGFVFGYLCYDMIHYATHHFPMTSRIGLLLKHHHVKHHYQDETRGYGVSSPLWDVIFRTMFPEKKASTSPAKPT